MRILLIVLLFLAVGCDKEIRETYQQVRQSTNSKFRECGTDLQQSIFLNNVRGKKHRFMEELAVETVKKKEKFLKMMKKYNINFSVGIDEKLNACTLSEEELYLNNGALIAIKVLMAYEGVFERLHRDVGFIDFNEIKLIVVDATGEELSQMNEDAKIIVIDDRRIFPIYINLGSDRFQNFGRGSSEDVNFGAKLLRLGMPENSERIDTVQQGRKDRTEVTRPVESGDPVAPPNETITGEVIMR